MIRRTSRCILRKYPKSLWSGRAFRRGYSSPSASLGGHQQPSPVSMLGGLTNELDRIAPRFEIQASQIEILESPNLFYETLKVSALFISRRDIPDATDGIWNHV